MNESNKWLQLALRKITEFNLSQRINFFIYCGLFVLILGSFLCCFFFHYVSAKFHLWPSSGDLPRKCGRNVVKEETRQKNYQDEDKKSAINEKKLILRLRSLISK